MGVDAERLEKACREVLLAIGEDPDREGLVETPRRWANWWRELIEYDPGKVATTFSGIEADQMVVVSGVRVWSVCEHHLLPFWCDIAMGYIADGKILGLSKFARLARKHGSKLQVQERLVASIADELEELVGTGDVAVLAEGEHLCMTMRGIRSEALMTSSVMRGVFRERPSTREEFLTLSRGGKRR